MIRQRRSPAPAAAVGRHPWPNPGDTALDRSRAIARSLHAALAKVDPQAAEAQANAAAAFGELWLVPQLDAAAGRRLTDDQAAALVGRHPVTIRRWISAGTAAGRLTRHHDGIDETELLDFVDATKNPTPQEGTRAA